MSTDSRSGRAPGAPASLDAAIGDVDWTVPPEGSVRSWFSAPSGDLAVVSLGDPAQPRVVLVPGATGSKEDFALMLPLLARAGYFVQSFDIAGQYESHAAGANSAYTYELFVADLIAFLDAGAPAHLLGYSFAGIVAQLVAIRRPDLVRSLTLLTTPPGSGNVFASMKWLGPLAPITTPHRGAGLMIWGIVTNKNRVPPRRLEFVRSRFALTSRRSVDEIVGLMMVAPDLRSRVRTLPIPKLVVAGSHDLWPLAAHARFAHDIDAEFRAYPTGHSPSETTPHQLTADLLDLYSRARA
ncbi:MULTISPECIES: alpha/beta fold hydrolase [unclassified Microbacterium]|uniref:alpha/beta fold hydrolase n=1 Tax=unclassified Microbacterium TaxID=2609290 RepID=UPI000CFAF801|nr:MULTISPECIES: alpha/beta fold hydrolase [unclassified Microbacterium]PQZ50955.1 alpha/beta hydrolase [Microbacterium sp. MYb43]PQZ69688.1 alpha/beta hydrolase [Microbacterium sp. MYb40]PRB16419.1 alpha/beta hydrolase [Microbacterium sp. MYb54]PRB31402.1 alpha/beta hydrolase [Microbacterium sp. MYb50]PRB67684.1 alpha/beta hydrolase [Microbacterium sp. MYb32]